MLKKAILLFYLVFVTTYSHSQALPFDSVAFSPDGEYVLVYQDISSGLPDASDWELYKKGVNVIEDTDILIKKDTVYILTEQNLGKLNCILYTFGVDTSYYNYKSKYSIIQFIDKYKLTIGGSQLSADKFGISIDTIRSFRQHVTSKQAYLFDDDTMLIAHTIKFSWYVNNKLIFSDTTQTTTRNQQDFMDNWDRGYSQIPKTSHLFYSRDGHSLFLKSRYLKYKYNIYDSFDTDLNEVKSIPYNMEGFKEIRVLFNRE